MTEATVRNEYLWFYGADNGSTGFEVILQQRETLTGDKQFHTLFRIEPGGDATAIGMMVASLNPVAGAMAHLIESDPRPADNGDL